MASKCTNCGLLVPHTTLAIPSAGSYPLRFGVVADIGFTINSTITLQNLFDDEPEVFTLGECGLSHCV